MAISNVGTAGEDETQVEEERSGGQEWRRRREEDS